jgi:hypothetical protein
VRRFQHAAGPGQLHHRFGVRRLHEPDAAVGGGGDPVPLVLIAAEPLPGLGRELQAAGALRAFGPGRWTFGPSRWTFGPSRCCTVSLT